MAVAALVQGGRDPTGPLLGHKAKWAGLNCEIKRENGMVAGLCGPN
jgi:hypothetical protein